MAASVTYTFVPGTDAEGGQVNQNFTDLVNFLNGLDVIALTVPITVANGGTGGQTAEQARSNLGVPGIPVLISQGGTGANNLADAQTALGIPSDIPVPLAEGGTGGNSALTARINLGLGSAAVQTASFFSQATDWTTNQVLGANGSQPFTGGLIIKWGAGTFPNTTANTSSQAVVFPVAFPNGCYHVEVSVGGNANSGSGVQPTVGYRSRTAAGFTAQADTLGVAAFNQTVPYTWFAIGS